MGRSSNKVPRFTGGGDDEPRDAGPSMAHSAEFEQKQIELLMAPSNRMSWEEYKEKHKEQLQDRLGAGVEKEQREYRKKLDQERNRKLSRGHNNKHLAEDDQEKDKKKDKKEKKKEKKAKKKEKKEKKRKDKKEKKRKREESDSSSSSSSSSDDESGERRKKAKQDEQSEEQAGPVRLSDFHSGKYDD